MTNLTVSAANTQAIAIDFKLLDNRYVIELNAIKTKVVWLRYSAQLQPS